MRVKLEVYGVPPDPASLDLSAYRIVQEALTNVVKHAGNGARCTVHLGYDEGVLAIRVTDDGGSSTTLPRYGGPPAAGRADEQRGGLADGCRPGGGGPSVSGRGRGQDTSTRSDRPGPQRPRDRRRLAGAEQPPATAGHGIIGMRERAHLCGGKFSARPLAEGGFQVTASLPLTTTSSDAETMA